MDKKSLKEPKNVYHKESILFGRLIMQLQRLERHPRTFGEAGPLTPSEIHTIDAIGCDEGILMGQLADRLGVTKGAVTQIVTRLEAKGLVKRASHPEDFRSIVVSLSEQGKSAYRCHEELHINIYNQVINQLDRQEIEVFERILEKLNRIFES